MNDPFWTSSYFIAKEIKERLQYPTFVGFNEFSSPTLPHALSQAAQSSSDLVIVVTPMLTPGGGHPERDIPLAIEKIQQSYPNIEIRYAWPNNPEEIETSLMKSVALLSEQVRSFSANSEGPVVLIQHGVPISGYSNEKLQTLIRECENQSASCKTLQEEYLGLAQNNKYWSSSMKMGKMMSEVLQREVYVGFNEFAYPTADMVLYEAALSYNKGPIDVVTSMLTQGGDHGEKDIPESLKRVSSKLGNTVKESFTFAWPYPVEKVANFLIDQIKSAHNED
ncbi:MAG: CbiX/SirB N-terminal domain-containing protein [Bdellovibrionales bacterium]|nr:CbiX/SirB N-terminal domain-containing protein [Bdellovibrionales bacterium]